MSRRAKWTDRVVAGLVVAFIAGVLAAIAFSGGCALIPQERQAALKQEATQGLGSKTTTDVVATSKPVPLPPMKFRLTGRDGSTVEVDQPVPTVTEIKAKTTVDESAESRTTGTLSESVKIPLSVALLIGAIACAIFLVLLFIVIRKSTAVRTLVTGLDTLATNAIHRIQSEAAKSTDPNVTTVLQSLANDIQRDRFNLTP